MEWNDRRWRLLVAQLVGAAAGWAGGYRQPQPTRAEAIAELRAITDDPAVLADAAAANTFVYGQRWFRGAQVQLLLDAGADPELLVQVYVDRHANRGGFDLGRFAQELGATVDVRR